MQFWFVTPELNVYYLFVGVLWYLHTQDLKNYLLSSASATSHYSFTSSLTVTIGSQVINRKQKFLFYKELECEMVSFLSLTSIIKPKKIPIPKLLIVNITPFSFHKIEQTTTYFVP